ncbi:MAG: hypothetical protein ABIH56_04270 [Candidatus Margulisiibacteriota bacterium]
MGAAVFNPINIFIYVLIVGILFWSLVVKLKTVKDCWKFILTHLNWRVISKPFNTICSSYITGIILWVLMCIAIVSFEICYSGLKGKEYYLLYFIPFLGLIIFLIWNCYLSTLAKGNNENDEVELIKFVERHANYLILGIAGVFTAAQFWQNSVAISKLFFLFMILSMLFSVCGVLPILWSPTKNHLKWLRHYKTIWYGYSIYLFFAGVLSLLISML